MKNSITSCLVLLFLFACISDGYTQKKVSIPESRQARATEYDNFQFGLKLGLRYNHGLLNINNLDDRDSNSLNTRILQLSVGYSF